MLVPYAVAFAVSIAHGDADEGLLRPQRFALIEQRLFIARKIQHTRLADTHRPALAFSQEIHARPQELGSDEIVVAHGEPGFGIVAVFAA